MTKFEPGDIVEYTGITEASQKAAIGSVGIIRCTTDGGPNSSHWIVDWVVRTCPVWAGSPGKETVMGANVKKIGHVDPVMLEVNHASHET